MLIHSFALSAVACSVISRSSVLVAFRLLMLAVVIFAASEIVVYPGAYSIAHLKLLVARLMEMMLRSRP